MPESIADERAVEEQLARTRRLHPGSADEHRRTQGRIASSIIWLFIAVVVALCGAYLWAPYAPEHFTAGVDKARDVANTLLLPIVTLVLGYYFGKRAE